MMKNNFYMSLQTVGLYKGLFLFLMLSVSLVACAENKQEIGKPFIKHERGVNIIDSAVLSSSGVYILNHGFLTQYDINPFKKIRSIKVDFDGSQTYPIIYKTYLTSDESRIIINLRNKIILMDVASGKTIKETIFSSELAILDGDKFVTFSSTYKDKKTVEAERKKGTYIEDPFKRKNVAIWDAYTLTKIKEFPFNGDSNVYISGLDIMQYINKYIVFVSGSGSHERGTVTLLNDKTYHPDTILFQIGGAEIHMSTDLQKIYIKCVLENMDDEFWAAFDELDRIRLIEDTKALLQTQHRTMGIAEIAKHLSPLHDLESIVLWLDMALQADVSIHNETEIVDIKNKEQQSMRFTVPIVELSAGATNDLEMEG